MPTYEYRCAECGHEFEQFQLITATPLRKCPACQQRALQRLLGAGAGIIFKGSGFYQTDYRTESYQKAAAADSSASSAKTDDSAGKSAANEAPAKTAPVSESTTGNAPSKERSGRPAGTRTGKKRVAAGKTA